MYVRVTGDLQPALTLSSFSGSFHGGLFPTNGYAEVTAVIANTGNVALSGTVTVTGSTWFGIGVGDPVEVELMEMLPGANRTVTYQLANVPQAGFVRPKMLLRSAVEGDAPDPGPLPMVEREVFVLAMPWLVIGVVVIGGGGGWLLLRSRKRRDKARTAAWIAYTEAEAVRKADTSAGSTVDPPAGTTRGASVDRPMAEVQ